MSQKKAFTDRRNFFAAIEVDEEIAGGFGQIKAEAEEDGRFIDRPSKLHGRYVSVQGLQCLMHAGIVAIEKAIKEKNTIGYPFGGLPWNIRNIAHSCIKWQEGWDWFYFTIDGKKLPRSQADVIIEEYARFSGWLKAAAELPALRRVIKKTQSSRGMNSPYTTINLWELQRKFRSPGRLERLLWATRERTEAILSAWAGPKRTPSWWAITVGLFADAHVGKAAVVATALTLGAGRRYDYKKITFAQARDFLVETRTEKFPINDTTDGVVGRRDAKPALCRFGIEVFRLRTEDNYGYNFIWLVRSSSGRTYHHEGGTATFALREAVYAWRSQDAMTQKEADLIGFLKGDETGFCPLITYGDSYKAGNCRPGTRSWLARYGWANRKFIPGVWLIPHLSEERVRRVVVAARDALPLAA